MEDELRKSGIEVIGSVPWGTHFCQFYRTKQDLIDILVPYFKAGLENNEFCMWVTAEPLKTTSARAALRQAVPDLDGYIQKGQIEIIPHTKWYLLGGKFDDERVLNGWVSKLEQALERGYSGLRLTGNTFWLERNGWQAFTEYEAKVNNVIGKYRMLAICTYCLDKCDGADVVDVVKNHQFALIKEEDKWDIIESSVYRQAKEALIESEEKYRNIVETAEEGIWICDTDARTIFVNKKMAELLGYSQEEMMGKMVYDFTDPEAKELAKSNLERRMQGKKDKYEQKYIRKDGSTLWVIASAAPMLDRSGKVVASLGMLTDITERKKAEEELLRLNRELRALSDCNQAIVRATDEQTLFTDVCHIMCDVVGYRMAWVGSVEHDEAKSIRPLAWYGADNGYLAKASITWADTERGRGPTGIAARTGKTDFCQDFVTESKAAPWREGALARGFRSSIAIPLFDQEDSAFAVLSLYAAEPNGFTPAEVRLLEELARDLAFGIAVLRTKQERLKAEEELRESEQYLKTLFDASTGGLLVIESETHKIADANPAIIKMVGIDKEKIIGHVCHKFVCPAEMGKCPITDLKQRVDTSECVLLKVNGEEMPVLKSVVPITRYGRQYLLELLVDITERKRVEQMKDEFISLVSHELRTPMTVITGSLRTAMSEGISLEDKQVLLQNAIESSDSLSAILENMLELSRHQAGRLQLHKEPTNIPVVTKSVMDTLKARGAGQKFLADFPDDLPLVDADPLRVERILYNLLENAVKYSPEESEIKVFAREEKELVVIGVADKGIGISPEDRARLFELFERLEKGARLQGLGLGLVVCKRLAEAQGGQIWVESEPGKGSTFYFTLPVNRKTA
jgi:PAS domain S-box-containing protein